MISDLALLLPQPPTMSFGAKVALVAAVFAILGQAVQWYLGAIKVREFRAGQAKLKQEAAERELAQKRREQQDLHDLITRVCKEFTENEHYLLKQDQNIIELARKVTMEDFRERAAEYAQIAYNVTDREFKQRASSFAGSEGTNARFDAVERRVESLEERLGKKLTELRAGIKDDFAAASRELLAEMRLING